MTPRQNLFVILLAMAVSVGCSWQVQDWRMGKKIAEQAGLHKDELALVSATASAQVLAEQNKRLATEEVMAKSDQQHTKELSDAKRNQTRLRDQLATDAVRLSVLLDATDTASGCNVPAATGSIGVVHAARRAQLDSAHAQRIIAITDEGDDGLIALRACQAYARALISQP